MSQGMFEFLLLIFVLGIVGIPLLMLKLIANYREKRRLEDLEWWSSQEIRDN